jgi:hypothetical protein
MTITRTAERPNNNVAHLPDQKGEHWRDVRKQIAKTVTLLIGVLGLYAVWRWEMSSLDGRVKEQKDRFSLTTTKTNTLRTPHFQQSSLPLEPAAIDLTPPSNLNTAKHQKQMLQPFRPNISAPTKRCISLSNGEPLPNWIQFAKGIFPNRPEDDVPRKSTIIITASDFTGSTTTMRIEGFEEEFPPNEKSLYTSPKQTFCNEIAAALDQNGKNHHEEPSAHVVAKRAHSLCYRFFLNSKVKKDLEESAVNSETPK